MKLTVLNVIRRHGVGKETGRPYDFTVLQYLEPVEQIETEKFHQEGAGFDTNDIPATSEVLAYLKTQKLPGTFEFTTDTRKTPRGIEVVLLGVK